MTDPIPSTHYTIDKYDMTDNRWHTFDNVATNHHAAVARIFTISVGDPNVVHALKTDESGILFMVMNGRYI